MIPLLLTELLIERRIAFRFLMGRDVALKNDLTLNATSP